MIGKFLNLSEIQFLCLKVGYFKGEGDPFTGLKRMNELELILIKEMLTSKY